MKIRVDIDNTICDTKGMDYMDAVPRMKNIEYVNGLYDSGHHIVYWTARGQGSGTDWHDRTLKQLQSWGCKFHRLECTKPVYDLFVDDKSCRTFEEFRQLITMDVKKKKQQP
jgi:hypothetical protein